MSRRGLFGTAVALPAIVVALVGVGSLALNAGGSWVWPPDDVTLPEAVATGNYGEVTRLLDRGTDPNVADDVRPTLLGSGPTRVTPLQAAVWARSPLMLKILLDRGAIAGPTSLTVLKCMNDRYGNQEVRELLDALPAASSTPCADVRLPE